jgi:hypothetical protein
MSMDKQLLKDLLDGNVVAVIHESGDVTFLMDEETMLDNPDQSRMFSRFYLVSNPSWVLRAVLSVEAFFTYASTAIYDWFQNR